MTDSLQLATGERLPAVGFGLWKIDRSETAGMVEQALRAGYRHLDCAADYGNEAEAGAGLRKSLADGVCRRDGVWVTSKLWNTDHHRGHVRAAAEKSLRDLGLDYLDLYLVHFPIALEHVPHDVRYPAGWIYEPDAPRPAMKPARVPLAETWQGMEDLVQAGLVKNIGVCNYGTSLLRDLLNYCTIRPAVLQVELHPFLTQSKLVRFCREQQIAVTGFSPLGAASYYQLNMARPEESVLSQRAVTSAAQRLNRTPAQIVLRWGVQRGTAVIPKTSRRERLRENLALFDFELSPTEMQALDALDRGRRFNDPGVFCEAAFNTFCPIYE